MPMASDSRLSEMRIMEVIASMPRPMGRIYRFKQGAFDDFNTQSKVPVIVF